MQSAPSGACLENIWCHLLWGVSARRALEGRFAVPFGPSDGPQKRLLGVYSRVDPLGG